MQNSSFFAAITVGLVFAFGACTTDPPEDRPCPVGSEGCQCTIGGSCDPALVCLSRLCVRQSTGGDAQGGDSMGGDSPVGDSAGGDSSAGDSQGGDLVGGDTSSGDAAPMACLDHSECGSQYCHFASSWTSGESGVCSAPCASNSQCDFSQECISNRCYTNMDCNPDNGSTDCAPGEVCNRQSRVCTAPPLQCYFNEQCPVGWLCDVVTTYECFDPNAAGDCAVALDCNSVSGCQPGICDCDNGNCRFIATCDPTGDIGAQCGTGFYCAVDLCQSAISCIGQAECTPYGLACIGNYCINL